MTIEELVQNEAVDLPIKGDGNFVAAIEARLRSYLSLIEQLDEGSIGIPEVFVDVHYVKEVQRKFTAGLLDVIKIYYDGSPAKAYQKLQNTLVNDLKNFGEILKQVGYEKGQSFYRMRIKDDNFPLEAKQMFHIPFELRGKVATQRYSIPGFPCLYLGRTLYGCWEEMNRPNLDSFQAVRLETTETISCIDLTKPGHNNYRTREYYLYMMTWPLIACCSVAVWNYEDSFKPEYIIPQLLLQWIRENHQLDGIRYNSTHIDINASKSEGDFSNVVVPVKTSATSGLCQQLVKTFKMTESTSWQLVELATGGGRFFFTHAEDEALNKKISKLELMKGKVYPYSYSSLGKLERYLDGMEVKEVEG